MNKIRRRLRDNETSTTYCFTALADQRDRVYALFGIAQSEDCSALEANYSKSTETLSGRVSGHLAGKGHLLEFLYGLISFDNERLSSGMINLESENGIDIIDI